MSTAEELAEQAIAAGKFEDKEVVKDEPAKDDKTSKPEPGKDADGSGSDKQSEDKDSDGKSKISSGSDSEAGTDTGKEVSGDKPKEGEFTADDGIETEEVVADKQQPTDTNGVALSTAEQKYIADNIGEPLVIRGMRGDKEVELKVYAPEQIPADFKFASDQQMLAAQTAFVRMENKAQSLLGGFRNEASQTQARDFEVRENEGIRQDVAELQKAGEFPKFTVKPGDIGFDETPEANEMTDVLKIMVDRNEQYLKEYNQGRAYRHIGFREAYEMHQAKRPAKAKEAAQTKEDTERKQVADKIGTNQGLSASKLMKPTVRSGTRVEDILNRVEQEW